MIQVPKEEPSSFMTATGIGTALSPTVANHSQLRGGMRGGGSYRVRRCPQAISAD
jgi:hypothetical protein